MRVNYWIPPKYGTKFPNAVEKHNAIAKEYEDQYNNSYWRLYDRLTWDHMYEHLKDFISDSSIMLDAGGGTGKWSRQLINSGVSKSEIIDLAEKMMNQGKKYAKEFGLEDRINFSKQDIVNIEFDDNTFDIVISQGNPVSYCSNPYKAISELARVAKLGAPVVISVHNKTAMMNYFCFLTGKISIDDALKMAETSRVTTDYPVYAFSPLELKNVCESKGLEVISLIGKPCISGFVQSESYLNILDDEVGFEKTVKLEKIYWEDSSCLGLGGHLQIVCRKKK